MHSIYIGIPDSKVNIDDKGLLIANYFYFTINESKLPVLYYYWGQITCTLLSVSANYLYFTITKGKLLVLYYH